MSNRAEIESNGFGFTVRDDYSHHNVPYKGADEITDPVQVVKICYQACLGSDSESVLDFVLEREKGVAINGKWYDFEEIEKAFEKE